MRLPTRIKYTVTEHRVRTPFDAFLDTLHYLLKQKLSPATRKTVLSALGTLAKSQSMTKSCMEAFKVLRDLPITYVDEITEHFPPELWDLFDNRFNWEDE